MITKSFAIPIKFLYKYAKMLAIPAILGSIGACSSQKSGIQEMEIKFEKISDRFNPSQFEKVKHFVLEKGDKKTYRNYDCNNPHFDFGSFEVFFGADVGQKNILNDPSISDFNELVIYTNDNTRYFALIIVRKGDIKNQKQFTSKGMEEGHVYLMAMNGQSFKELENGVQKYLDVLIEKTKNY